MERFNTEYAFIERRTLEDTNAKGRFKVMAREVEAVRVNGIEALRMIKQQGWGTFSAQYEMKRLPDTLRELKSLMKSLENPLPKKKNIRVRLEAQEKSGESVLKTRNIVIGYPNAQLFTTDDVEVDRGDVIALIGGNGTGKSTFLKTVLEHLEPLGGRYNLGINVQVGYFAQAHDNLDPENQVIEELMRHKTGMVISDARHVLAQFLFRGDDIYKKVSTLSGGERGRLALGILSLTGANFLVLDEPTNHLDIPAQEILQDVLEEFNGTILLVSHDRYLIDRLANQIWEVRDGHMTAFRGTYQDYLVWQEKNAQETKTPKQKPARTPKTNNREVQELEAQIESLGRSISELERLIGTASENGKIEDVRKMGEEYKQQQERLEALQEQRAQLQAV